jgi:hypothetical protein
MTALYYATVPVVCAPPRLMKPRVLGLLRAAKYLAREKVGIQERVVEKLAEREVQPLNDLLLAPYTVILHRPVEVRDRVSGGRTKIR